MKYLVVIMALGVWISPVRGSAVAILVWGDQFAPGSCGVVPGSDRDTHGAKVYGIIMDGRALYAVTAPEAAYAKIEIAFHNPLQATMEVFLWDYAASGATGWTSIGTISDTGGVWTHAKPGFIGLTENPGQRFLSKAGEMRVLVLLPGGNPALGGTLSHINFLRFLFYDELTPFQQAVAREERSWLEGPQLVVTGEGKAPDQVTGQAQRRAAAVRAATLGAQRKMLELLQERGRPSPSKHQTTGWLKGAVVKKVEYLEDGTVRVYLVYTLDQD